jgi:hypothetical protein
VYERKRRGKKEERSTTEVGWGRWVKDQVQQQQASCAAKQQEEELDFQQLAM